MVRRRLFFGLLLCGAGAHVAFWYLPRVRSLAPARSWLARPAMAESGEHRALWVPYPHQNLGQLPEIEQVVSGLLTALGSPIVGLPRFGPFAVPPAEELLLVQDGAGARIELRLYPLTAGLTRLAGWLAGNPWLTGGTVQAGKQAVVVSWQGRTWNASSGALPEVGSAVDVALSSEAVVGVLRLPPMQSWKRPAVLMVSPQPGGLWLHPSGVPQALELAEAPVLGGRQLALAAFARSRPISGLLVFDRASGASGIPQIAALGEPGVAQQALPIKGLLGRELPHQSYPGGEVVALDRESLESALQLEPLWLAWVEPGSAGASARLWLDPAAAAAAAGRFDASDWLWLANREELLRWSGFQLLLDGLQCWEHITGAVSSDGRQMVVGGARRRRCAR